ncbi:MAG: dTDP-4-amino-4,6-dideoxygalactose transaminase [Pseudomonadota bacterium]
MIRFNTPCVTGNEFKYISQAINGKRLSGDSEYSHLCQDWIKENSGATKVLLTPSCTAALEMCALLIGIEPGDEVIMPSYTFVSTANAFALRGAKIIFIDVRPDTMNIDENKIEAAVTEKTKAIVPVHYAGVSCEMDRIMEVAKKYNLYVIEDAAQGMMSTYKGKPLGSIGDFGAFSFHETKNYTSGGEGGALLINNKEFSERAEIIREKGTNRSLFFRGQVDKYTWVDLGSSYLPSEIQAAYLYAQLEEAEKINEFRRSVFEYYFSELKDLKGKGIMQLPFIPDDCNANGHMFYIKVESLDIRTKLIDFLKDKGVMAVFHYIPLHSSPAGKKIGSFSGEDIYTTADSERLVRLPIWYGMKEEQLKYVVKCVYEFFGVKK